MLVTQDPIRTFSTTGLKAMSNIVSITARHLDQSARGHLEAEFRACIIAPHGTRAIVVTLQC
jgi:hypothetical protein